jgi:hypothetical protein
MKKVLSLILYKVRELAHFLDRKLTEYAYIPKDTKQEEFLGLAPDNNVIEEEFEHYEAEIKKALNSIHIKNIAISGAYGAGKSSVLRTFEKKYPEYQYINISLASFNAQKEIPSKAEKRFEAKIEKSILQQLFYKVEGKKLPFSKFKRIKNTSKVMTFLKAIAFFLWLTCAYILYKDFTVTSTYLSSLFTADYLKTIVILGFSLGSLVTLYMLGRVAGNSVLNKLTLKGTEIAVPGSSNLNKFLDEILYFFEVTPYRVVVIEDLDRHNNDSIFTKLRELNTLINNSEQVKRDLPIKFIYAIRDEMFTGTERTKFFDYIIPIIPVITPSNAGTILIQNLESDNLNKQITPSFINAIAIYIEDMRMLKNIYYEFLLYKDCINVKVVQEELEKLFGLIVYKNCFPEDFACLHRNEGLLVKIFNHKHKLIDKKRQSLDEQIKLKEKRLEKIKHEHLRGEEELRRLYVGTLVAKVPNVCNVNLPSIGQLTVTQLSSEENFKAFKELGNTQASTLQGNGYQTNPPSISFSDLENEVGLYNEREGLIYRNGGDESLIQQEIIDLKRKKVEVGVEKLSSLIDYEFRDTLKELSKGDSKEEALETILKEQEDLIIFLLRNGYIDENYHSYISYFREGSLKQLEHEFIKNVQNQRYTDIDAILENCAEVFDRLSILDLKSHVSFNFYLLKHVLSLKEPLEEKADAYLENICSGSTASVSFLAKYLTWEKANKQDLLKILFVRLPFAWSLLVKELGDIREEKEKLFKLMLKHTDKKEIISAAKSDKKEGLITFISESFGFLQNLSKDYFEKRDSIVSELNIKFLQVGSFNKEDVFSSFVYENNHYFISYTNISVLVEAYNPETPQSSLCDAPLTTLFITDCEPLKGYIKNHLQDYVKNVLLTQTSAPKESEETMLYLINSEELPVDLKNKVMAKVNLTFSDITKIEDTDYWDHLLNESYIKPSWDNVYYYYLKFNNEGEELPQVLVIFLNKENTYEQLSMKKVAKKDFDDEDQGLVLFENIYLCNDLSDESYRVLLEATRVRWTNLFLEVLSEEKVRLLIITKSLVFNEKNMLSIENHFKDLCLEFVGQNVEEYLNTPELYDLDAKELLALYDRDDIELSYKVKLSTLVEEADFSAEPNLVASVTSCVLNADNIEDLNTGIIVSLISLHDNLEDKKKLLAKTMSSISKEDVLEGLKVIGDGYDILLAGKHPKIKNNDENTLLLEALEMKGIVSSFDLVKGMYEVRPKRNLL